MRLFNTAIALWLALNILPIGIGQFVAGVQEGCRYSRSLDFYNDRTLLQWLRMPGDLAFMAAGAILPVDLIAKLRYGRQATIAEGDEVRTLVSAPGKPAAAATRM